MSDSRGDMVKVDMIELGEVKAYHVRIQREGQGVRPTLKNHKNIEFLSNTCPDPLNNHKATKPAFNFGPSSARQRNAV